MPEAIAANRKHLSDKKTEKDANYTMLQAFEWNTPGGGKHWKYLAEQVEKLADMGITASWLPPPTKGASPESTGYDAYDLWDLGEFDQKGSKETKWGSKEDLVAAIKKAKDAGMVCYIDAVLNHKGGADEPETFLAKEVDQNDLNKELTEAYDIEGWTSFKFDGRGDKYSKMKWHSYHFTGVDYDNKNQKNGIFKIVGNQNKDWTTGDDQTQDGTYDYLMMADIDFDHPEPCEDYKRWGAWVIKELGIVGFRLDAVRHIKEGFISDFLKHCRENIPKQAKPIFAVGEYFSEEVGKLHEYLDKFEGTVSLFDTPLHDNMHEAGEQGADYDMRKIFDGTLVKERPVDAVTFVDNHDTQPGQTCESWVAPQFKPLAYALILLRGDGYPCVSALAKFTSFGGDLWGLNKDGKTADAMSQLEDFIRSRKWFAYGETRDYWDHPNTIGWVRMGDDHHDACAVVMTNGTNGSKRMEVGKDRAGQVWTDVLGWCQGETTIGEDGWADFKCSDSSVSIWTDKQARGRDTFGKE